MNRARVFPAAMTIVFVLLSLTAGACGHSATPQPALAFTVPPAASPSKEPTLRPALTPSTVDRTNPTATPAPVVSPGTGPTLRPTIYSPATAAPTTVVSPAQTTAVTTSANPIILENQQPGTVDWDNKPGFDVPNRFMQIAGYANPVSANVGDSIQFAISTRTAGLGYSIYVYRLGWYNGASGRLMHTKTGLIGQAQGYWDYASGGIRDCPTCEIDPTTGLVDTHWQTSYSLTVPGDWVSGEYLVKLLGEQGQVAYIVFVVRDDKRSSDILVQIPVNTYQAYNNWGGKSLYPFNSSGKPTISGGARAVKVSFNRPITSMDGSKIYFDIEAIRFLEKNGYDVTYTTCADVDANPASLNDHRAFVSVGHDEYWTAGMRDAVEQARDAGVNLAFFGGNDVYWQARYEPDRDGQARRWLVVYKDASIDPMAKSDPRLVTVRWISAPVNRPQNSLTGTIYGSQTLGHAAAWVVASSAPAMLLAGTGLKPGDSVPGFLGAECDVVANNGHQPANLVVVAASPMKNITNGTTICNSTWYQAASGAYVFDAGITFWTLALDNWGQHPPGVADPRMQKLSINVLAAFGSHPATPTMP